MTTYFVVWLITALIVGGAFGALFERISNRSEIRKVLEANAKMLAAKIAAETEASEALTYAAQQRKRAEDQFKVIEDVIKERGTWQSIYQAQSIQAVAAQEWLMRDLNRLLFVSNQLLKAAGKPPIGIDKRLEELILEYKGAHPAPTVEAALAIVEPKRLPPGPEQAPKPGTP